MTEYGFADKICKDAKNRPPFGGRFVLLFCRELLGVVHAVHVLDQLQHLVGVADLVEWVHPL